MLKSVMFFKGYGADVKVSYPFAAALGTAAAWAAWNFFAGGMDKSK